MIHRRRRFVDMRIIHRRMNEQDARRQLQAGTLFPAFLKPEVIPYTTVEIVHVDNTVTTIAADGTVTTSPKPEGGDQ